MAQLATLLLECLALCLAVNWLAFIFAAAWQTEAFYDITGTFTALVLLARAIPMSTLTSSSPSTVQLASGLFLVWTLRLGVFLLYRVALFGHDSRFKKLKRQPASFFVVWTGQALWIWVMAVPLLLLQSSTGPGLVPLPAALGVGVWILGFVLEVVADVQKFNFRRDPVNKGRFIQAGLYSLARYPQYFGEWLLWLGFAILCSSGVDSWAKAAATPSAPVFSYLLIYFVSGVSLQERQAAKRWAGDEGYQQYRNRTRLFLPLPLFGRASSVSESKPRQE